MIVITGELALRPAQKKSLMSFACFARPRSSLRNEKQRRCGRGLASQRGASAVSSRLLGCLGGLFVREGPN